MLGYAVEMLQVQEAKKRYGPQQVLAGVSLSVCEGEIVGLAGPNGAGKTTLLKCIVGINRLDSGHVRVDGIDAITHSLAARRLIGYSPSETSLYHRLRAEELLRFAIHYHPTGDVNAGLRLLDELGVPKKRRIGQLSHGMKRKVLLAQALASNAPLLMLDEPMEAFDPSARQAAITLLREAAESGRAVLCSSHDLDGTQRLCDRVVFLNGGRIIREGATGEILEEASRIAHLQFRTALQRTDLPSPKGWIWKGEGRYWTLIYPDVAESIMPDLAQLPIASLRIGDATLDEVFASLYQAGRP